MRKTGDVGRQCWRPPGQSVSPRAVTGRISGCIVVNHAGGEAVAVARSTAMPLWCSRSSTVSSHSNVQVSAVGCRCAQANTPTVTMLTPASRIIRTSESQTDRGHCSGL